MKKPRFSDNQIIAILKEAEAGVPVPDLGSKTGHPVALYPTWQADPKCIR